MPIDSISVLQSHHLVMLLREFYNTVILSEEQCVEFLRENQLLVQDADHPPCARCGHVMEQSLSYVDRILEQKFACRPHTRTAPSILCRPHTRTAPNDKLMCQS